MDLSRGLYGSRGYHSDLHGYTYGFAGLSTDLYYIAILQTLRICLPVCTDWMGWNSVRPRHLRSPNLSAFLPVSNVCLIGLLFPHLVSWPSPWLPQTAMEIADILGGLLKTLQTIRQWRMTHFNKIYCLFEIITNIVLMRLHLWTSLIKGFRCFFAVTIPAPVSDQTQYYHAAQPSVVFFEVSGIVV